MLVQENVLKGEHSRLKAHKNIYKDQALLFRVLSLWQGNSIWWWWLFNPCISACDQKIFATYGEGLQKL